MHAAYVKAETDESGTTASTHQEERRLDLLDYIFDVSDDDLEAVAGVNFTEVKKTIFSMHAMGCRC